MTLPTRRPGLVTLLLILVVIEGLFSIVIGLLFVLARDSATVNGDLVADGATGSSVALWLGILLIARGLANGNGFARLLVAAVTVVNIVGGLWLLVAHPGAARWSTLASILLGVIVLAILYSPKASAFFRSN